MKVSRRTTLFCIFLMLNLFTMIFSVNVKAQTTYTVDISQDDQFTWEVRELNLNNFKKVFGYEPGFEEGDQLRKRITDVIETSYGWNLIIENFDYGSDFNSNGSVETYSLYKTPEEYSDNIFIPTPIEDYLQEASETWSGDYQLQGVRTVVKLNPNYRLEMEYNDQGIKVSEAYYDKNDILLVRVEGNFTVPFGNYFMGFLAFSVIGLVIVLLKKGNLSVLDSY